MKYKYYLQDTKSPRKLENVYYFSSSKLVSIAKEILESTVHKVHHA